MKFFLGMLVGAAVTFYLTVDVSIIVVRDMSSYNHTELGGFDYDHGSADSYDNYSKEKSKE